MSEVFSLAQQLEQCGDLAAAKQLYSKLLREDPTNTSTLLTTAEFLSRNGKSYEASNCLLRILQLDPSHLRAKELLQSTGEFTDHSLHAYPENKGTPFDVQAFRKTLNRGLELAKARQFQAALEVFELATQIHPRSAEAFAYIGCLQIELKQDGQAIESLLTSLSHCGGQAGLYLNLGGLYERQGKTETAIQCFKAAIQCDPYCEKALLNLGQIVASRRMFKEAIEHFAKAIQIVPTSFDANYQLGVVLYLMGDFVAASHCLRHALQFNPHDANCFALLAHALANQGELLAGAEAAENALRIQPNHEGALGSLIQQLQHLCKWNDLDILSQ